MDVKEMYIDTSRKMADYPRLPPTPPLTPPSSTTFVSPTPTASSLAHYQLPQQQHAVPEQDFWSVDKLNHRFREGIERNNHTTAEKETRRHTNQNFSRIARSSLLSVPRSHAPYPASKTLQPRIYYWEGIAWEMEPTRIVSRPKSSASSVSTRSMFSRHKPMSSASSSANSSRTSLDTDFSSITFDDIIEAKNINGLGLKFSEKAAKEISRPFRHSTSDIRSHTRILCKPPKLRSDPSSPIRSSSGQKYKSRVGEGFKALPEEILRGVLAELKKSHLEPGSQGCSTCWTRDLINLGLACKKWWYIARKELYEDIQLTGLDSVAHAKKRFKIKYGTRLVLLRRTLRLRSTVAGYVKSLKVPSMSEAAKTEKEQDQYLDLVASVVMACPNLERMPGFYPPYRHEFSRLPHALSTRKRLLERVWVIDPVEEPAKPATEKKSKQPSSKALTSLSAGQRIDFLDYHTDWTYMQTLILHCNPGGTIDSLLSTDIFSSLPSLKNLCVSSFPSTSFNDKTLMTLPPLTSLRLDNLHGITSRGLSHYASIQSSTTLQTLSLISLPLLSLPVLARLFSHLASLHTFTLSQTVSPIGISVFLYPYLASTSLSSLHWEFTNPNDNAATEILSKSILHGGFPALRRLRAPLDPNGILQDLCIPVLQIARADDTRKINPETEKHYEYHLSDILLRSHNALGSHPIKPGKGIGENSPLSAKDGENNRKEDGKGASLALARCMAQKRIDNARTKGKKPRYKIQVWDEEGKCVERNELGCFVGMVGSKIVYDLDDGDGDVEGGKSDVGVLGVGEWLRRGEDGWFKGKEKEKEKGKKEEETCMGGWSAGDEKKRRGRDREKDKERWWHTERPKWREMGVEKLFA